MIELGKFNFLEIEKVIKQGAYLLTGDDNPSILLPTKYIPENVNVGDKLNVFIYRDSEDKLIATTLQPLAEVDDFAYLKVKSIGKFGAFLDWGLVKDLLLPYREQKEKVEIGKYYIVRLYVDKLTNRIVATQHINKFLRDNKIELNRGDEVNVIICDETDIGFKVIVNSKHWGIIYKNQIFSDIVTGQKMKAWVKLIRDNGKIDITLQQPGLKEVLSAEDKILKMLEEQNGYSNLNDNSIPDEIYSELEMSKKVFKKAIGKLFRENKILITENGIQLL